jgi:hypothetical protein
MQLTSDGRPSARERGYTVRWEKAARRFLLKHPVCTRFGKDKGCTAVAQHVDHVTPTVEISDSSGTAVIGRGSANHVTTGRLQRSEAVASQCCTTSMGCQ